MSAQATLNQQALGACGSKGGDGAGRQARLRELQGLGFDLEAPIAGRSLMSWACGWGRVDAMRDLASLGARVAPGERMELTTLGAMHGDEALDLALSLGCALGATPLHWAARGGNVAGIEILVDAGAEIEARDRAGGSPLREAAIRDKSAGVRALLDHGARIDERDEGGMTPLDRAREAGSDACSALIQAEGAARERAMLGKSISEPDRAARRPSL